MSWSTIQSLETGGIPVGGCTFRSSGPTGAAWNGRVDVIEPGVLSKSNNHVRKKYNVAAIAVLFCLMATGCLGQGFSDTPSPTSIPTPTPTATPTPTPTAIPISVGGDPRAAALSTPFPDASAPCGVVDLFDFPIDPPDGLDVTRGGGDFGVYRSRYDGYHAGEDWGGPTGRPALGSSVYSIGHGTVTYAEPLGWGADQGVVILRHTFVDGSSVLSFYGHLDPDSIVLSVGDCVARGDRVGRIGRPRSSPHLHFEIRTHMPTTPGPGYWFEDPTLAGWLPPSQTIWNSRIAALPGVQWTRPAVLRGTRAVGTLGADTFVGIEEGQLVGIDLQDGSLSWAQIPSVLLGTSVIDSSQPVIYVRNQAGPIQALRAPDPSSGESTVGDSYLTPLWEIEADLEGVASTLPLPGGGLVASGRRGVLGLAPDGEQLWRYDITLQVFDWLVWDDKLIVSTTNGDGAVYALDSSGMVTWTAQIGGHLALTDDLVWIYGVDGVYRLDPDTQSAERMYTLPPATLSAGDIVALPDGILLAHTDRFDRRLIALDLNGSVHWERSIADSVLGRQQGLLVLSGQPFLLSKYYEGLERGLVIYAVDVETAELTRVFIGGTRERISQSTWWREVGDDRILVNLGKGAMCAFNPLQALEVISQSP